MLKKSKRRLIKLLVLALITTAVIIIKNNIKKTATVDTPPEWPPTGTIVHTHSKIPIYSNGEKVYQSHGKHHAKDGYYYGHKWQCVEFVKRYYHDAHNHQMPNIWGHAKDYFDPIIPHASLNPGRNMTQYTNGQNEPPKPNDLLVWNKGPYGHVAIITAVNKDTITVVQQNIKHHPTQTIPYTSKNNTHTIAPNHPPVGWLRITQITPQ